jgi:hypothetical protein
MAVRAAFLTGHIYPEEDSWYSFLLEAESTTDRAVVRGWKS